jgi:photosystem II stability/assembly factor-like uncharacterized protein
MVRRSAVVLCTAALVLALGACSGGVTPSSSPIPTAGVSSVAPSSTSSAAASTTPTLPTREVASLRAVQFLDTSTGWVAGAGAILVTHDGGETWQRTYAGSADFAEIDFVDGSNGWAVAAGTLLRTTDGGDSWESLGEPTPPIDNVHFFSSTEGWGVAGGQVDPTVASGPILPIGDASLIHTADGGRTWSTQNAPAHPQSVCFPSASDGWFSSGPSMYRSTDGGATWSKAFTLPLSDLPSTAVGEVECTRGGSAWVRFSGLGVAAGHSAYVLYATQDGGRHWHAVLDEAGTIGGEIPAPAGPGTAPGPFSLIDAGTAFFIGTCPPCDSAQQVRAVLVTNGTNVGPAQAVTGVGLSPLAVAFVDPQHGWVAGAGAGHGVVVATTDGGATWRMVFPVSS